MRLLLVEDEARLAAQLKSYVEREAFAVDLMSDGAAALTKARGTDYDCLLLDLGLPGDIDGMPVCRAVRDAGNAVPILILTARDGIASRVAGLDAGADDYLVKPFAPEELAARLRPLGSPGAGFVVQFRTFTD